MVYQEANQTSTYPRVKEQYKTTNQHFHDQPLAKEPSKKSTFGKLYANSTYFMQRRLDPKSATKATSSSMQLTQTERPLTWSGRLPESSYVGNGTFELANGLSYSWRSNKPVKLVPYAALTKTEYQAKYNRGAATAEHPSWVSGRAPYSVQYSGSGRFGGQS